MQISRTVQLPKFMDPKNSMKANTSKRQVGKDEP